MAKGAKYVKPTERAVLDLTVLATEQVSPNFVRVTVGGDDLARFEATGFDQWFRLFLPGPNGLHAPTRSDGLWVAEWAVRSATKRLVGRNYTVRAFRGAGEGRHGAGPELDLDVLLHTDDSGHGTSAAASWARTAQPGDPLAILDEGRMYNPAPGTEWQVLAGDESAMPAILGILASSAPELSTVAFIEVGDAADVQPAEVPASVELHWLVRERSTEDVAGALVWERLRTAELPPGRGYAFFAGNAKLGRTVQKHLVGDRAMDKTSVTTAAYWR